MGKMSSCGCLLDLVFVFDCKRSLVSPDVESRSAVIVVAPLVARPDGRHGCFRDSLSSPHLVPLTFDLVPNAHARAGTSTLHNYYWLVREIT